MPRQEVIPLQGRDNELDALRAHVERARDGSVSIALVHGEPGIGKSRLLAEAASQLEHSGFKITRGFGEELASLRPLGPVLDALSLEPPAPIEYETPEGWRYRTTQLALDRLEEAARAGPLLLVLDDLQWADRATWAFIRAAAARVSGCALAVIGAHRPVPRDPLFADAIEALVQQGAMRIALEPLAEDAVRALAASVLHAAPSESLLTLARGAGGNPLYITELLSAAADSGRVAIVDEQARLTADPLPRALSVLLERRVRALTNETADVLNVAAVLGDGFAPHTLASVLGRPTGAILPALDEALSAGILAADQDRMAFRHDLLRDAVYRRIPSPLRASLHLDAAKILMAQGGQTSVAAAHLLRGAHTADAAPSLRAAADQLQSTAPTAAIELLERALELMSGSDPDRAAVTIALVRLQAWAGRPQEAAARAEVLLSRGIDEAAEAQLRVGLAEAMIFRGLPDAVLEQVARALQLSHLPDVALAPLMAASAHARLFTGEFDRVPDDAATSVKAADRAGDAASACFALLARAIAERNAGRLEESRSTAEEAVRRADNGPVQARHRHPRLFLAPTLMTLGMPKEADDAYLAGRASAEALGSVWALAPYSAFRSILLRTWGKWDEAIAEAEAAIALGDELDQPNVTPMACGVLVEIHAHRNDFVTAQRYHDRGEELIRRGVTWTVQFFTWGSAALAALRGDPAAAHKIMIDGGIDRELMGVLVMEHGLAAQMLKVLLAVGDTGRAHRLVRSLMDASERSPSVVALRAAAIHGEGLLAGDPGRLLEAAEMFGSTEFIPASAAAYEDAGAALAEGGQEGAPALLTRSLELFGQLGAELDVARVEGRLRQHGFRRRGRPARRSGESGWESLTPAEDRIARLVAEGLSNPQIAARLFISRHTVESHLKRVFAKLDVASRVELARGAPRDPQ
jgi:DNA-binding CsgD family transcriptional regulator/tetratricopeptide (TPR) repeat protein